MLTLFRRHMQTCPHRDKGRAFTKCSCPIHCDGVVRGRRIREALDTINWNRAIRLVAELEEEAAGGRARKPMHEAIEAFLSDRTIEPSTMRKYRRIMNLIQAFADARGIATVDRFELTDLDRYRATRALCALTWSKELQLLRTFFAFCGKRKWIEENPAKDMTMPSDPKPRPRLPYTAEEVAKIVRACDTFGNGTYERARARAMILLMRYFALRVSDVATLRRDRVVDGNLFIHAVKNAAPVWAPIGDYPDLQFALDVLPAPIGAPADCEYYFWTGLGARDGHIKTVDRTLQAVFRKSGVKDA